MDGASSTWRSARAPGLITPTSSRRNACAPPAVAAHTASSTLIRICSTAVVTQNAIDEVYEEPGLQLLASATVAPASSRARAGGSDCRVERSHAGSSVATVSDDASASMSGADR